MSLFWRGNCQDELLSILGLVRDVRLKILGFGDFKVNHHTGKNQKRNSKYYTERIERLKNFWFEKILELTDWHELGRAP